NRDGVVDIVAVNRWRTGDPNAPISTWNGSASVLLGNGDGSFRSAVVTPLVGISNPVAVAVGDYNGDGKADLAIVDNGQFNASLDAFVPGSSKLIVLLG